MNFESLFNLYYEKHATVRTKQPMNARYFFNRHGSFWAQSDVGTITKWEVQDWFDDIGLKRGRPAANRAINLMSAIIEWGLKRGYVSPNVINPCKGVDRFRMRSRERFLLPAEFERFKQALEQEDSLLRDFIWMLLLTGARRGTVQSMKWFDIDLNLALWHIKNDKNHESRYVPLSTAALAILARRMTYTDSDYVFPGDGITGHLVEPRRAWKRILKCANIEDLRLHDLRRTLGSYLAIKGASSYLIGKVLGHRDQRSTAVYARLNLEPVRAAMEEVQITFLSQ